MTEQPAEEYVPPLSELLGDVLDDIPVLPANPLEMIQLGMSGSSEIDEFKKAALDFCQELISRIDQQGLEIKALQVEVQRVRELTLCRC